MSIRVGSVMFTAAQDIGETTGMLSAILVVMIYYDYAREGAVKFHNYVAETGGFVL